MRKYFINFIIVALLVGGGVFISKSILDSAPKAEKRVKEKRATLVEIIEITPSTHTIEFNTFGVVQKRDESSITPEVSGIVEKIRDIDIGEHINRGDFLAKIECSDYEIERDRAEAELTKAKADFEIEQGLQKIAKKEYELLGEEIKAEDRNLLLREPELKKANALIKGAEVLLNRAEKNVERCTIYAKATGVISAKNFSIGDRISTSSELIRILDVSSFLIESELSGEELDYIDKDSKAYIVFDEGKKREVEIVHILPLVDERSKKHKVILKVENPLEGEDRVYIGSIVEINFRGKKLENSAKISWSNVREKESIWTYSDGRLEIKTPEVLFRGEKYLLYDIENPIKVITTNIGQRAVEGMKLEILKKESK